MRLPANNIDLLMRRLTRITLLLAASILYSCTTSFPEASSGGRGELPVYSGDSLRNIFYPLGGIGTGNILLGGRGNILEFEIFNESGLDELPPHMTFFSLWCREEGSKALSRVLERQHFDDFSNPFGVPRQQLSGLPRFAEAHWEGAPPQVALSLEDPLVPLQVRMEAFNPLVPLDVEASSYPLGEVAWILENEGEEGVDFSLSFTFSNPMKNLNHRGPKPGHLSRSALYEAGRTRGILMQNFLEESHPEKGSVLVSTDYPSTRVNTGIVAERWWDDAHLIWDDLSRDGRITVKEEAVEQEGTREVVSVLQATGRIEPGQRDTIRFWISWHVPNRVFESTQAFGTEEIRGAATRNFYARNWQDATEVLADYLRERDRLVAGSQAFYEAVTESSIPGFVKDALLSNLATLKSNLLSRVENGDVHGFEGMGMDFGCCPGNCTHVWNYAQAMASLFPSLERNVRETAFLTQTFESGYQCFRTTFPVGEHHFRSVAADGQMGNIMRVYREWKYSGDSTWLASLWPPVSRALEYAWTGPDPDSREGAWVREFKAWDPDRTGVLSGEQHNTYDVNFYGPNMFTGCLYLGALRACAEMASYLGDPRAACYQSVYRSGLSAYDSLLWNGQWWEQQVEEGHDRYQYGSGCLSDQLLGQYLAFQSGLGYLLDSVKVRQCLASIHAHNFIPDMRIFQNVQRVYALNQEAGLVLCTWPKGQREAIPFPYADEVWTGVEYQAAATMIRAGLVEEGLEIVQAIRGRYAGYNRNPYSEIESGYYYARALASWALLDALNGFLWDGAAGKMRFDPVLETESYRTFWTCGTGWGRAYLEENTFSLHLDHGSLVLGQLILPGMAGTPSVKTEWKGKRIETNWNASTGMLEFPGELLLSPGNTLTITPD